MKSDKRTRPTRFDAPVSTSEPDTQSAPTQVTSNIESGTILLAGPNGDVAIEWRKDQKDRRRSLPSGTYRMRTARVERERKGQHWFLSATAQPRKSIEFESNGQVELTVADKVHFNGRVKRKGRTLSLNFAIHSGAHQGLSIYKNDKRVPVTYQLLSKKGKVLASGTMEYG